jgi:hypothetical protein
MRGLSTWRIMSITKMGLAAPIICRIPVTITGVVRINAATTVATIIVRGGR